MRMHAPDTQQTCSAVVTYADNRALREELYRGYLNRASSGRLDNTPVIERMLALRRETAQILGYDNFAELSMATKVGGQSAAARPASASACLSADAV